MKKTILSGCASLAIALIPMLAQARAPQAAIVYSRFLDELKLRSMPGAMECGVAARDASESALACAEQAAAKGRPFWFARPLQGIDSELWIGVASNGHDSLYRLYFDSDTHGGGAPHPKPTLDAFNCPVVDRQVVDVRTIKWSFEWKGCKPVDLLSPPAPTKR